MTARTIRSRAALPLVAALVLGLPAGCGSDGEAGGPRATAPTESDDPEVGAGAEPSAPGEGEPIAFPVTTEVAAEGTVGVVVTPIDGGVLDTIGPDGTRYVLTMPPGAVLEHTVVTMTPLVGISGEHVDGMVGGVHLEPSGLQLAVGAELSIEPAREVPTSSQVPFGYEGDGTEITAAFIVPDGARTVVWVEHFSGYGVLESTDLRMEMNRRLAAQEARRGDVYRHRIAEALMTGRDATRGEISATALAEAEAIRQEMIREHLAPRLDYAERLASSGNPGDLEYINGVIAEVLASERSAQLMGTATEVPAHLWATIIRIREKVLAAMEHRCRADHDFTVIPILVELEKALAMLADRSDTDLASDGCGTFELRFRSEIEFPDFPDHYELWPAIVARSEATVRVAMGSRSSATSPAPLEWVWEDIDPQCPVRGSQHKVGELHAGSISFRWATAGASGARSRADGRLAPPDDLEMLYDVGEGGTHIVWDDCSTSGWWSGDWVADAWTALHRDDATGSWPRWRAIEWEMLFDGPLVARKSYERQIEDLEVCFTGVCWPFGLTVVERTTLELVHTPR